MKIDLRFVLRSSTIFLILSQSEAVLLLISVAAFHGTKALKKYVIHGLLLFNTLFVMLTLFRSKNKNDSILLKWQRLCLYMYKYTSLPCLQVKEATTISIGPFHQQGINGLTSYCVLRRLISIRIISVMNNIALFYSCKEPGNRTRRPHRVPHTEDHIQSAWWLQACQINIP